MKKTILKAIFLVVTVICIMCIPVIPTYAAKQGTDGDELQVKEAEQLELRLGVEWADVEFRLKTDAGLYPEPVSVDKDGVLRLEIGGSSKYILSCVNSAVPAPEPDGSPLSSETTQAPATTETESEQNNSETDSAEEGSGATVAGIPVLHIVLFAGGMVVAIGALIAMHVVKRRRENEPVYDDDDE